MEVVVADTTGTGLAVGVGVGVGLAVAGDPHEASRMAASKMERLIGFP